MKTRKHLSFVKVLSALLCLIMFFGLVQAPAFAEGEINPEPVLAPEGAPEPGISPLGLGVEVTLDAPTSDTINEAITKATEETTIILKADATLDKQIVVPDGKDITIKGAEGQDITVKGSIGYGEYLFDVAVGGKLTLGSDLTLDGSGNYVYHLAKVYGTLVVDGCIIKDLWFGSQKGAIWAYGENATFQMESGSITGTTITSAYTAAVYLQDRAKGIMNGGTIEKTFGSANYGGSGSVLIDNADFVMNDGEIKNNSLKQAIDGSGGVVVYAVEPNSMKAKFDNSTFTMNGGTISGNESFSGGGVIVNAGSYSFNDFYSKASFIMNGGSITGNSANGVQALYGGYVTAGGGGVFVQYGGKFTMNGGSITDNVVNGGNGGGVATSDWFVGAAKGKVQYSVYNGVMVNGLDMGKWPEFFPAKFTMNGGVISGNEAHSAPGILSGSDGGCGGGIYIASAYNEINAGTIENNKADDQGGGCYVGSVPYSLSIYKSIITNNTASLIGGGVWICPTGDVKAYIYDGTACYGNTAKSAADAIAIVRNADSTTTTILSDRMLGGGPANWYKDGEIDDSILGNPVLTTPRYDPNGNSNTLVSIPYLSTEPYSLTSAPSDATTKLAASLATVFIQGNSSVRGGGIGSNGSIYFGKSWEGDVEAKVTKIWDTSAYEDKTIHDEITVWLVLDGYKVESVKLNAANGWTHTFTDLPKNVKVSFVEDEVPGFDVTYSNMQQILVTGNWDGTITNTKNDSGSLKVTKTVSGNATSAGKEFDFTVKLTDAADKPVSGTFGEMTFVNGEATFKLKQSESKTAKWLPVGAKYTVTENSDGYIPTITVDGSAAAAATGTIAANKTSTVVINNEKSSGGSSSPDPASVIIKAVKTLDNAVPTGSDFSFILKDENGKEIETVKNNGGDVTFKALTFSQTGTYRYTVTEVKGTDGAINYDAVSYTVIINVTKPGDYHATVTCEKNGAAYTGTPVFTNTTTPTENPIAVAVKKVWDDSSSASRPVSVQVQLYKDSAAYGDAVVLNAANGWRYEWRNLDKSAAWTVDEVNVPDGYSKSVIHEGNDWTITNKTDTPPATPPTAPPADTPDNVPLTGDTSNIGLWLTLALCSLAGLLTVAIYGKKKDTARRGK